MEPTAFIFYAFAAIALLSALFILFTRQVLYAAFALIFTFLAVAGIYIMAGADFLGITQILVYVGGVLVLIIFGIMLTNRVAGQKVETGHHNRFWGGLIGLGWITLLSYAVFTHTFGQMEWMVQARNAGNILEGSTFQRIGVLLMSDFLLPFEMMAVILLLALIGAAFIAKKYIQN